jgi:predicted alpha/beta hydrolase family esterase
MKTILFVHGGGEGAYDADAKLVSSLASELGPDYEIRYPRMPNEASPDYTPWRQLILTELADIGSGAILVGHSMGASILIKALTDDGEGDAPGSIFLISAPFWSPGVWQWGEVALPEDASDRLPSSVPIFLYHSRDDEEVPYAHLDLYRRAFPRAVVRRLTGRNHQLNDDLSEVAADIGRLDCFSPGSGRFR